MIRQAVLADKPHLLRLWKEGYADTPFNDMEYDDTYVEQMFAALLDNSDVVFARVVEQEGEVVGILIGVVDNNFWGVPIAQAIISYSRQETDKLIRQFTTWAKDKGVKSVTVTTVPGKEKYKQLIETLGFKNSGNIYTKEV